jgi:ppGpp synthetase/RelA/SpoT-type nucleotidyltranferase
VNMLQRDLRNEGIWAEVSYRTKETDSLIRKLIKKPNHSYDSIGDKTGVRIILRYKNEIQPVLDLAKRIFEFGDLENKEDTLDFDQVGYLSVHVDIKLRSDHDKSIIYPSPKFHAELQVRTMAQHLWSEMSHDTFYKNDESLNPLQNSIKRRVYLLSGVVEMADNEFDKLNTDVPSLPELELLKSLEKHYFKLTTRRSDSELSLDVIRMLMPLYNKETQDITMHLDNFFDEHKDLFAEIYEEAEELPERSAYLYQPEAIMIYDLLSDDPIAIRKIWNAKYSEKELELIANSFGISFD